MKKRIKYIDIAKGIAIFFIVLGHTLVHSENCHLIFKLLYSFHVVLFFILSGYTFKIKENESFLNFFKNKFIRIAIPYIIWAFLFLIPYMILGQKIGENIGTTSSFNLSTQIFNILYGIGYYSALKQNSSLWFLPALFSMEIIYYFIIKYTENHKYREKITLLILTLIGFISTSMMTICLPWGINTALNIGFFFYIGYLSKKHNLFAKEKLFKFYYIIPITILGIIACYLNSQSISCIDYSYGSFLLAIISGLCLSLTTVYISFLINNNRILEYIGKNTMGILIFHKLIIILFQTKIEPFASLLKSSNIFVELGLSILVSILSIIFSLICTEITRKVLPLLIGEKTQNSI